MCRLRFPRGKEVEVVEVRSSPVTRSGSKFLTSTQEREKQSPRLFAAFYSRKRRS